MKTGIWLPAFLLAGFSLFAQTKEGEEKTEESSALEEKHRSSVWFSLLKEKNPDYFLVKKLYEDYFAQHNEEESKARETGASWLKTNVFYLDARNRVAEPPAVNYNTLPAFPRRTLATVTDTMAGNWRMLGPRNSVQTRYAGLGNMGGYVNCARIDPSNPQKLFIGFITGGLWVSFNGGKVWQLADQHLPDKEYIDIDVCRANGNRVYAIQQGAVVKSDDGGLNWMPTALNATNYPNAKAYDIAVSPEDPAIVLARWGTDLYRTADGGKSWKVVMSGLSNYTVWGGTNINAEMLDFHAAHTNRAYLIDRSDKQNFVTLYYSSNGGENFVKGGDIPIPASVKDTVVGWAKILSATNNPGRLYLAMGTGNNAYGHHHVHLYQLNSANGAIVSAKADMIAGKQELHHGDIAMDLQNDQLLVYGTYSEGRAHYSTDNGNSFTTSSTAVHSDLRALSVVNGQVLLGSDGEASWSTDNGKTFVNLTNAISNHELWGFGSSFKTGLLGAGLNHGPLMIREHEGEGGWYNAMGADQGNSDVNPLDDRYLYSQGYSSYHVIRTAPRTMNYRTPQQIDPGGIYAYFNSMEFHPNLYYTLVTHHAGGYPKGNQNLPVWKKSLIRSDDNGLTIRVVKTFEKEVFREKICMTVPAAMYVVEGTVKNRLWKTTNSGLDWEEITPPAGITGAEIRNISDVAVSDVHPGEIWVTYSGVQNSCQVLHSVDGGKTYTNLTSTVLTSFPLTKIIFQRGTNGGVYVGNKAGIFYRNNRMSDWKPVGNGLPMLDVRFMFINYYQEKLLIGTSRGAWENNLCEHSATMAQISANRDTVSNAEDSVYFKDYSVVKKGAAVTYQWKFPGGTPSTSTLENPVISYAHAKPGSYSVTLKVTAEHGKSSQTLKHFIRVLPQEKKIVPKKEGKTVK